MALVQPSAVPIYFDEMLKYIRDTIAQRMASLSEGESLQAIKKQNPAVKRGFSGGYEFL